MATRRKVHDPAQLNNEQVLRDRQARIEEKRVPVPDLGMALPESNPASAAEFLRDEFDRKTFGDDLPTTRRIVYGPDPLFDSCPGMRAAIEKIGIHDYADATYQAVLSKGPLAVADNVLRSGLAAAISKFGVEQVAIAFRDRLLKIPCREIEYQVERDLDVQIAGDRVFDETVARYGHPGMAVKFLSQRCNDVLGLRGYQIVKDEHGDPVKVGTLIMGEIPQLIAVKRRAYYAKLAQDSIDEEVEKYAAEAERFAHQSGHAGVGPLAPNEVFTAAATERDESLLGQSRPARFTREEQLNG